jgi:hypothetical protein
MPTTTTAYALNGAEYLTAILNYCCPASFGIFITGIGMFRDWVSNLFPSDRSNYYWWMFV